MAKLALLPGLVVTVLVDGAPATEHDDPDEIQVEHEEPEVVEYQIARTLSKYIESITGQHFSIKFEVGPPLGHDQMIYTKLVIEVEVDGIPAWTCFCARPFFKKHPEATWEDRVEGVKEGKGRNCTLKEFQFAKIETNSDTTALDVIKRQAQRMQKKGTIEIKVYHGDYGKKGGNTTGTSKGFLSKNSISIPEKSLKGNAKSHGTSLGEAKKVRRGDVYRCKKKDGEDYPLAIFKFMYRSQEALKQLLIIPRTPSPSPSRSPTPEPDEELIDGLTAAQYAQVQSMVRQMASENVGRAKRERGRSSRKIKQEIIESRGLGGRSGHAGKKGKGKNGQPVVVVIDDSDDETGGQSLFMD